MKMGQIAKLLLALAIAWNSGCGGGSQSASTGGNATGISVSVFPTTTSVVLGKTVPFSATVTGTANTAVNWEVAGVQGGNATVGTITTTGLYTAPLVLPNPTTVVVTAVSQVDPSKSGTGRVQIFQSNPNQNAQSLPVKLGTSGGNIDDKSGKFCCGGTLGSLLSRNGSFYILSNNHVLARSDQASPGEPISQPSIIETNCSTVGTNTVANLTSFVNLQASGNNVDAAIALIVPGAVDLTGNILLLGGTATGSTSDSGPPHQGAGIRAAVGMTVAKSGRTTGLTCSTVSTTSLSTSVSYQTTCNGSTSFSVTYRNQVAVSGSGFSSGGDSGSLIVSQATADPVALLYGGSDTETVGNPVGDVLAALADSLGNQPSFVGSAATHQVIGCTLPGAAVKAAAQAGVAVDPASISLAERARDLHAPELLANPYISAVGVAASADRPGEAAVLIVVNPGREPTPLPAIIEGVGTRIVSMKGQAPHGILEFEAASQIAPAQDEFAVSTLDPMELERAKVVHSAHVDELMKLPGVQGVGITSSADAPGEAALMIYLIRGAKHNPIPAVVDGLRTRVRETSRFTAGRRGQEPEQGCKVQMGNTAEHKALRGKIGSTAVQTTQRSSE
jgi:hypothetical protein